MSNNGIPISGKLHAPTSGADWPCVVVAHGSAGMAGKFGELIDDFCQQLAIAGILAFAPSYFEATKTSPGAATATEADFNSWVDLLGEAIPYLQGITGAGVGRVGLVGFSLGANIALRAASTPTVKAYVDFFGPVTMIPASKITPAIASNLPPTLIHHGKLDQIVSPSESATLAEWLKGKSCVYDPNAFPNDGHPGQSFIPGLLPKEWNSQSAATIQTLAFLAKWL
jgi:dienelactone hydrolase